MDRAAPSFVTFYRRWVAVWKQYLVFRKSSQHAQCLTCFELQQQMHNKGVGWAAKMKAAADMFQHNQQQYLDRCLYWSLRWASRAFQDVLCVIIDTPDRTRYAWPRFPYHKLPKDLAGILRPRIVVTGVIAHGYCTTLFYADENRPHGGAAFLEALMRTVSRVQRLCTEAGRAFPRHLVIQSDNTVAQAKNSLVMLMLAVLVSCGYFSTAVINFLMVGHTHEDIDQLFGILIHYILRKSSWQTPKELLDFLASQLQGHFTGKGEELTAEPLGSTRDFKAWLQPLETRLYNAFATRGGIETPHSFTFKIARDLTQAERGTGVQESGMQPLDVVCCVKTYMRDQHLQHEPVVVLPAGATNRLASLQPATLLELKPWKPDALAGFLDLADRCNHDHGMPLAGAALRTLATERQQIPPLDPWPANLIQRTLLPMQTRNPYFPHLPTSSFRLLVKRPQA